MSKHCISKENIKAIILAGSRDFGRCPLASRWPTVLWPVVDKPAIERLLQHLLHQGIKQAIVCSNGNASLLQRSIAATNPMRLKFLDELLPAGTSGCIRDATCSEIDTLLLVFPGNIVSPPEIDMLIQAHHNGKSDLTVVFNPPPEQCQSGAEPAGIYICEPTVLEYIPEEGYHDIKESLIPEMLQAGKNVYAARLVRPVGNFRNRKEYLYAIGDYLNSAGKESLNLPVFKRTDSQTLWMASDVEIDSSVRIYGPVVIMDEATISKKAVIFGPTIIGRNASIGRDSLIVNSVLWDGAQVGENCEIQRCLFDYNTVTPDSSVVEEQEVPYQQKTILQTAISETIRFANNEASKFQPLLQNRFEKVNKLPSWVQSHKKKIVPWFAASLILIAFIWSYQSEIIDLWSIWQRSDEYSSGLLVPFLAIYILWSRRHDIAQCRIRPSLWGAFAFLVAQGIRLFGTFFMYGSAERLSIALSIAALVLLLFGWQLFRKVSTVLLFLCLMLPWPTRVQTAVTLPLQHWATSSAVFCLEMIGYEAIQEGNIVHIGEATVAVAEACNGLRMITAFFVISGMVVLLVKRAWWEKLTVLASSLPIALLCNTVRLAITAIAFTVVSGEYWEKIFHDFGGYAMMPLALAVVVAEFWLLAKLTTPPTKEEAKIITRQRGDSIRNHNRRRTKK